MIYVNAMILSFLIYALLKTSLLQHILKLVTQVCELILQIFTISKYLQRLPARLVVCNSDVETMGW